jgi:hypothetical protein
MPGFSGMMQVNNKGLPHLEQGGRNSFDICALSAIVITDIMDIVRNGKRPPTEAALLFLSSLLFHELDVSLNLIGNHDPAAREIC